MSKQLPEGPSEPVKAMRNLLYEEEKKHEGKGVQMRPSLRDIIKSFRSTKELAYAPRQLAEVKEPYRKKEHTARHSATTKITGRGAISITRGFPCSSKEQKEERRKRVLQHDFTA